jgi:hypothetical protein
VLELWGAEFQVCAGMGISFSTTISLQYDCPSIFLLFDRFSFDEIPFRATFLKFQSRFLQLFQLHRTGVYNHLSSQLLTFLSQPIDTHLHPPPARLQENDALLLREEHASLFDAICAREHAPYACVGRVTGDGRVIVRDSLDGSTPVDLALAHVLADMPQKTFDMRRVAMVHPPLALPAGMSIRCGRVIASITVHPCNSHSFSSKQAMKVRVIWRAMVFCFFSRKNVEIFFLHTSHSRLTADRTRTVFTPHADLTVAAALDRVLRLLSVGSKRFLTSKVDRAVTGLIAQQPCVGPLHTPCADVAVVAQVQVLGGRAVTERQTDWQHPHS